MSTTYNGPWTWEGLADHLARSRDGERPIANNTRARWATVDGERNGCIVIRLHATDIVTLTPPTDDIPVIQLNTGGWWSVTTMDRMQRVLTADHGGNGPVGHIYRNGTYTVHGPSRRETSRWGGVPYWAGTYAYHYAASDGMIIDMRPGETYGHPMPAHRIPVDRNGNLLRYAGPGPRREDEREGVAA